MMDGRATPDLQSILATLAQFAPPAVTAEESSNTENISVPAGSNGTSQRGYELASPEVRALESRQTSGIPAARPTIDPATITTWQDGLRCVTKIAAHNNQFGASIRRMIVTQRNEETRWYSERQQLKRVQARRQLSAARAQSILSTLGSHSEAAGEVDDETELTEFDRGIHASQRQLHAAMTAELKPLGVPFFGTDSDLVVAEGARGSDAPTADDRPSWSPTVSSSELQALQKRMVAHLEDLYRP